MNVSRLTRSISGLTLLTLSAVCCAQPPESSFPSDIRRPAWQNSARVASAPQRSDSDPSQPVAMFPARSNATSQRPQVRTESTDTGRPGYVEPNGFDAASSRAWSQASPSLNFNRAANNRQPASAVPTTSDGSTNRQPVSAERSDWQASSNGQAPAMFPPRQRPVPSFEDDNHNVSQPTQKSTAAQWQPAERTDQRPAFEPPQWSVPRQSDRGMPSRVDEPVASNAQPFAERRVAEFPVPSRSESLVPPPLDLPTAQDPTAQNPTPDAAILNPLLQSAESGPILFQGIEELPVDDEFAAFATFPDPRTPYPALPELDPALENAGNGDGELDWIDLIEEYAGRATRSDIPAEPHATHPEKRSWLRLDHWRVDATFIPSSGDRFGLFTGYGSATIGLPKIKGVTLKPAFAYNSVDGPDAFAIPETLYDASVEAAWMTRIDERWRMRIATTGGVYSDNGRATFLESARVGGMSLFTYEWHPDLQVVVGSLFVNIDDLLVLPILGVVYQPDDDRRYEFVFPEGKLAQKIRTETEKTRWVYLSWGFFGRTWRVDRPNGLTDKLTYSDWRVSTGIENKSISGIASFAEVGVSFARDVEFGFSSGSYRPGTVGFARVGLHF